MTSTTSRPRQRPILVSFSGIDGAGKSTQIEALRARLTELGLRVVLITFWDDVARLTRIREISGHRLFKGEKGVGTPDKPVNRRDKNVDSGYMTPVRFCLYFLDAASLTGMVAKTQRAEADVVIFDRYIYDELANLNSRNRIMRTYVRLLLRLTPQPDIGFLLDADPGEARARKPEYPLDFLHRSRTSYLALSQIAGMTVIAPQSVQDVENRILQEFQNVTLLPDIRNTPPEGCIADPRAL
jgi:thymidylate kinase